MTTRTLVTGFGPFGEVKQNPSSFLAENCGRPFELLEVSYEAVVDFFGSLDRQRFDSLVLLGVNAKAKRMEIELVARNVICETPDVRGQVPSCKLVRPGEVPALASTLWAGRLLTAEGLGQRCELSGDAGGYLCNFSFYEALRTFPDKQVGFLHVPSANTMPLDVQLEELMRILEIIEEPSTV